MAPAVVDLLVPPTCAVCPRRCADGICARCAVDLGDLALDDLGHARLGSGIEAVGAYEYAGVVAAAIRSVKTPGRHGPAAALGRLMRYEIGLPVPRRVPFAVTWVPSTRSRRRQRGAEIPRRLAGPGAVRLLERRREDPDQTSLGRAGRLVGPAGAFALTRPVPSAVILVDDVRTTGATATAAAQTLRSGGAGKVLVVTLAVVPDGPSAARP